MAFLIICVLAALINTFLGSFVFLRNPKGKANILFALLTGSIVGWIVTLLLYYLISDHLPLLFIGRLNFAISLPMTFLFYYFVSIFPKQSVRPPKMIFYVSSVMTCIVVILSLFTPYIDQDEIAKGAERFVTYGSLYPLWIIVFLWNLILGLVILIMKILRSKGFIKIQLIYLLLGFVLFISIGGTMNVAMPLLNNYSFQQFGPATTIFFVGLTTYAIVKHRLLNLRFLVARSVAYGVLIVSVSLLYVFLIVWVGSSFFGIKTTLTQDIVFTSIVLFISITYQPLKEIIKKVTDRFLYKSQYKPNFLLSELNTTMVQTVELDSLMEKILVEIVKGMHLVKGGIVLFENGQISEKKMIECVIDEKLEKENLFELAKHKRIIIYQEEENQALKDSLEQLDIGIAIPVYTGETIHGLVLLGDKKNGEIFTEEDIEFIELFVPNFAIATENARAFEKIKDFTTTLKSKVDEQTHDLQVANENLKDLDKLKDEFVAVASHELRTPMTVIRGNLWLIFKTDKTLSDDTKERLRVSSESAQHLIALVNEILDVSSIEGNKIQLKAEKINIDSFVKQVGKEISPLAHEKKISLSVAIDDNSLYAYADPQKIKQVLVNLLGNAIKFTKEQGEITISAEHKDGFVAISVKDTGTGIKEEDIPKLFTKFGKLETSFSKSSNVKGAGLGLYICKKLVEMSGGTISVKSNLGEGSVFSITLPSA